MKNTDNISFEELEKLSQKIREGLEEMLTFERRLNRFRKSTLVLFLALVIDPDRFEPTLKLLKDLEEVAPESQKRAGF